MTKPGRMPVYFIPHGGGPWPFMEAPARWGSDPWGGLKVFLEGLKSDVGVTPRAILIISGHWEKPERFTISTASRPGMLFDYYNFPPNTYELSYPAPGAPDLAAHVREVVAKAGIETDADDQRGFDHGVFIPLMVAFPDASIPVVMVSLQRDLDAGQHFAFGQALAPLRDEGILIVGSGMSYHNMRAFSSGAPDHVAEAKRFDRWLTDAVAIADTGQRAARLAGWVDNPDARACHVPDHDHLVPLFVAAGAGGEDPGRQVFSGEVLGKPYSGYRFG